MKTLPVFMTLLVLTAGAFGAENFDRLELGQSPKGWTVGITGSGEPKWTVTEDSSKNRILQQTGIVPKPSYPLCLRLKPEIKDGFVQVKFKTLKGEMDQAAGVVWRCQDANNYYICRANALEDNVVLYKVQDGKRTALPLVGRQAGYGLAQKVPPNQWHTLRVEFKGSQSVVFLNGRRLFEVEDSTFVQAGRLGLWTKADSVTAFDDFAWGGG